MNPEGYVSRGATLITGAMVADVDVAQQEGSNPSAPLIKTKLNNMAEFKEYQNKYLTIDYVNYTVVPMVYEVLVDSYGFGSDDYDGYVDDHLHEIIDGLDDVIWNYQARQICIAFELDPFGESEWTGEQNTSWNQMVYELIYNKVWDKYGEQLDEA